MNEQLDVKDKLVNCSLEEYGDNYKSHCLEIYKLYYEMADRISTRRQSANSFFLTINTVLVGFISYIQLGNAEGTSYHFLVSIAGMILCYYWYRLIKSYKQLNSGKFKVIHAIEKQLPLSTCDAEWDMVGRGKDPSLYLPFTNIEMRVPWIFFSLHIFVFVFPFPWQKLLSIISAG